MGKFDELWTRALEHVAGGLLSKGVDEGEVDGLTGLLRELNFPGALSVLGASGGDGELGPDFIGSIARLGAEREELKELGIDAAEAERLLTGLLMRRGGAEELLRDEKVLAILGEVAAKSLEKRGIGVTPEEARAAIRLLMTGEFFRDIAGATAAIASTLRELPLHLLKDVPRTPFSIPRLTVAVTRDLGGVLEAVPAVVVDLTDGVLNNPPTIMTHTLTWLYGVATVRRVAEMGRTLIAPENKSVRLAIILYARAHGIPRVDRRRMVSSLTRLA